MLAVSEKMDPTTSGLSERLGPDSLRENGVSLYVHIPFCVSKCRYCDFNSYALREQDIGRHVDAILKEAESRIQKLKPQTVFLGGGTPSILSPAQLKYLLDGLDDICGFRSSAMEVTMEANPESLDDATAAAAAQGGVDRISIGFQSLQADVLRAYDRVHSPDDSIRAFHAARNAGIKRINIDLIFAYPGQAPKQWYQDLAKVHALGPEHLSCYELAYEPGTALTRLKDVGRWQAEDPDICFDLFVNTRAQNEAAGFSAYEVSAFAQQGEQSLHNLTYWRNLDYVGIGAGAAGWHEGIRRRNIERPENYEAAIFSGQDPADESENSSPETILFDALMMGLRLPKEGVRLARLKRVSGLDLIQTHGSLLRDLQKENMVELIRDASGQAQSLRATERGFLLLDDILQRFLPDSPTLSV